MADHTGTQRIHGYCALCIARCGTVATVEDGRFTRLEPDPGHPTGHAICAKGRAAPELVYHAERLTHPLRRTHPKGDPDPGWQRISWDEALDLTAAAMRRVADRHGPQAVAFTVASGSTTAIGDSSGFIQRLANAFGTPNSKITLDVCGWGRAFATQYTYGVGSVGTAAGGAMPDIERSGVLILWGYNPSFTRLTHATAVVAALKRGMRLIVVDPRHVGLAGKADQWLRVRPGTDGALALGLANLMIERGWFDRDFIREWSNGPHLVRADTGRLLTERDCEPTGDAGRLLAWDSAAARLVPYDAAAGRYDGDIGSLALDGEYRVAMPQGEVVCHPVFELYRRLCRRYPPETVEAVCWVPRAEVQEAARLIWQARPVSYYAWSGHEHHTNVTQTARAMSLLYALTGSFDRPGGNVLFAGPPAAPIAGQDLPSARQMAPTLGVAERPLGPARWGWVGTPDLYRAILDGTPYPVRAMIGFGANVLLAHASGRHGREALKTLDFYAHLDLFMNPTAELADVVLPVASAFEREGLKLGFEISQEAQSLIQVRPAVVPPPGEARADTDIIFDLAGRLGLAADFWNGDIDAAYRHQLGPTGVTLEQLRAASAACACRSGLVTPSMPSWMRRARRAVSPHRRARSSSTRRRSSITATRPCPISRSRRSAPWRGRTWRRAFRWFSRARSRRCFARRTTAPCRACASAPGIPKSSCIPRRHRLAALPMATGLRSRLPRAARAPEPGSTPTSIRGWRWASMASGRPVPSSARPATIPSGPRARATTC